MLMVGTQAFCGKEGYTTPLKILTRLAEAFPLFRSVVLPFSSQFWLLAFCFGCFCAEEKTSADSRLGFLLSMREMKMRLPWNFWVTCQ